MGCLVRVIVAVIGVLATLLGVIGINAGGPGSFFRSDGLVALGVILVSIGLPLSIGTLVFPAIWERQEGRWVRVIVVVIGTITIPLGVIFIAAWETYWYNNSVIRSLGYPLVATGVLLLLFNYQITGSIRRLGKYLWGSTRRDTK